MKIYDKQNSNLRNQFSNIEWIADSGVSPEELEEMYNSIMQNNADLPKCLIKAKTFDMILRNSRIAVDTDDIFQDKLYGRYIIANQRWSWQSEIIRENNKTKDVPCSFGISPAGRWAPSPESCPAGSPRPAEGGMSGSCGNYYSYSDLFADTKKWVDEEWIDYLLPQVYSELGGGYDEVIDWWSKEMKDSPVKLYAGTALYQIDTWGDTLEIYYQEISMYYSFSKIFSLDFDVEWVYSERLKVSNDINDILIRI